MHVSTSVSALRKLLIAAMASQKKYEFASQLDERDNLQVINFGLSNTGTASIKAALEILGFGPGYNGLTLLDSVKLNEKFTDLVGEVNNGHLQTGPTASARLRELFKGHRSACDHPINQLVPEILEAYPNAKFIISTHEGGREGWWKAFSESTGLHWRKDWSYRLFRTLIYPITFIRQNDNLVQEEGVRMMQKHGTLGPDLYDLHMDDVEGRVPKRQLLTYNVKEGWGPLCKFLGCKVPDQPFPIIDEQKSSRMIYASMFAYGAVVWTCYAAAAASLLFFTMRPEATKGFFLSFWRLGSSMTSRVLGL